MGLSTLIRGPRGQRVMGWWWIPTWLPGHCLLATLILVECYELEVKAKCRENIETLPEGDDCDDEDLDTESDDVAD